MAIISIPTSIGGVSIPGQAGQVASGPLASLYGSKAITAINYPQDLATDASKSHYVQFSIKEIVPIQYDIKTENIQNSIGAAAATIGAAGNQNGVAGAVGAAAGVVTGVIKSGISTITSEISNIMKDPKVLAENVSKIEKQVVGLITNRKTTTSKAVISLYMPDQLTASYNASYTEISLKDQLGSRLTSLRNIAEIGGNVLGTLKNGLDATINAAASDPAMQKIILDDIASFTKAGGDLSNLALQSRGYASNPQMQMIYRGLDFRHFALEFTFTPKSRAEASIVDNIIYQFKYYSAPSFEKGKSLSTDSMFLIPPAIFNVMFMVKGVENKYLPKYTDCVLENVGVNYAPNGWAAHTDGAPIQTHLILTFKEIEIVDKARLSTGYNSPDDGTGLR